MPAADLLEAGELLQSAGTGEEGTRGAAGRTKGGGTHVTSGLLEIRRRRRDVWLVFANLSSCRQLLGCTGRDPVRPWNVGGGSQLVRRAQAMPGALAVAIGILGGVEAGTRGPGDVPTVTCRCETRLANMPLRRRARVKLECRRPRCTP